MDIDQLQEIYRLASQALKGRKRLAKLHNQYILNQEFSRRKTTSYNAKCADIITFPTQLNAIANLSYKYQSP